MLLICNSGCTSVNDWTAHTAYQEGTGVGNPTRPAVVIDTSNRELYVFTNAQTGLPGGRDIYYKVTDLGNIQFTATNIGTPLIKDSSLSPNNVTSTKQNLDGTTGPAALAVTGSRYVHNQFPLASPLQDISASGGGGGGSVAPGLSLIIVMLLIIIRVSAHKLKIED